MHSHQLSSPTQSVSLAFMPSEAWNVIKRCLLLVLGLTLVAIGFVGIFLPGVPTTGPLLGASFLLANSSPRLERRLLSSRIFRRYAPFLDGSRGIPQRARVAALLSMWTSITLSCCCLGLIDDSRATRRIIGDIMQRLGYEVTEACNGCEGLERLEQLGLPDIVLVDWNMPVMDGLEFIKAVRAVTAYADLPLMMVTTETEMQRMALAFVAGVNEYVMKPFDEAMIQEKLRLIGVGV